MEKLTKTTVECKCVSKKESANYNAEFPKQTEIELEVPYDQNSIFYKMSGGTNMVLRTVNQAAADMFELGGMYLLEISPVAPKES